MAEKKLNMHSKYRQILEMPDLSDCDIDEIRKPLIHIAQTICEHVWGERFY